LNNTSNLGRRGVGVSATEATLQMQQKFVQGWEKRVVYFPSCMALLGGAGAASAGTNVKGASSVEHLEKETKTKREGKSRVRCGGVARWKGGN